MKFIQLPIDKFIKRKKKLNRFHSVENDNEIYDLTAPLTMAMLSKYILPRILRVVSTSGRKLCFIN